eukprot:CAMPEP_0116957104 /NCGR_PEP_ID=MMETSP0467-20121206/43757_1 /TAXON_ID=283647 /ORGANISM="Mesodinium pulex, Strain SPMC105" /LENGTH=75 /DNA_ID=CAMNT_0004643759 /DNA_START=8 /DNA_END=231 /DNA_ORIENTATION=+
MAPILIRPKKTFTAEEVKQHNSETDCWIIIGLTSKKVYNITEYLDDHPGGVEVMMEFAGKDATSMFEEVGHSAQA